MWLLFEGMKKPLAVPAAFLWVSFLFCPDYEEICSG